MTTEKSIRYKKAYTELNDILKRLDKKQIEKIPKSFINNISKNMDNDYKFEFDISKGIFEQNLMVETEALLVEIYERYLSPVEEKEMWQKYDRYCLNKIEKDKKTRYNNNVFEKKEYNNIEKNTTIIPIKKENKNILKRFLNYIRSIFKR